MNILKGIKQLGVINITPNSFSDGGKNLNREVLISNLKYFANFKNLIIDVGFESTAPMNQAITSIEERQRFLFFIDQNKIIDQLKVLSIDSYKVENYPFFYDHLKKLNPDLKIIFNDVSGITDAELINFLKKHKDAYYIYSFTNVKKRSDVLNHMKSIFKGKNIVNLFNQKVLKVYKQFLSAGIEKKLIVDPAFGFSKSFEQNWQLIDRFHEVQIPADLPILIGFSKKSFLRLNINSNDPKEDSELIHYFLIKELEAVNPHIIFRTHNPHLCKNYSIK